MKVIDLLNKIANGEEVPKKIKFCLRNFEFSEYKQDYICRDNDEKHCYGMSICKWIFPTLLNDEVEIIEEKPTQEEIKEYTNKFLEAWIPVKKQFGKLFDEIARIGNVLDLEDELEEEKKIEKLNLDKDELLKNVIITAQDYVIEGKINEIIDVINEMKNENY